MDPNQYIPQGMQSINNQTQNSTSSHLETHVFHKMLKIQLRFNQRYFRYFQDQNDAVQTQLATLPVLKREVPISQPQIRHYGFKLGRPFRQPFRHIITYHKH